MSTESQDVAERTSWKQPGLRKIDILGRPRPTKDYHVDDEYEDEI